MTNPLITKITDKIYLGSFDHSLSRTKAFNDLDIDVIINCCSEISYSGDRYAIVHCRSHLPFDSFVILINEARLHDRLVVINYQLNHDSETLLLNKSHTDDGIEDIDDLVEKISFIDRSGLSMYFHCVNGDSRSPAILAFILMMVQNKSLDEAMEMISARDNVSITEPLMGELNSFAECNSFDN